MKFKICHILHSLNIGGLENGVINLINNLNGSRFEHSICCIDSSGPMAERLRVPVEIFSLQKGDRRDYLLPFKIAKVIKKIRPDIVHTRNWAAIDGVIGARLAGVRLVVHGEHGRDAADPMGKNHLRKKFRKILSPLISRMVTVSEDLKRWLIEDVGISANKVVKIINGVNTEFFKPSADKGLSKTELGFERDAFIIGGVGRLDLVKDFQTLLRAFAYLTGRDHKANLLLIGSGPEEHILRRVAAELGILNKVSFLGECSNVSGLMQAMDVFVLPSIAEGVSNTILEAMASRIPVVATGVGGNVELVDNGKTGFLFTPSDYGMLAETLAFYRSDPKTLSEHGFNGRKRAEERFSLLKMVKEYEQLYLSVAVH